MANALVSRMRDEMSSHTINSSHYGSAPAGPRCGYIIECSSLQFDSAWRLAGIILHDSGDSISLIHNLCVDSAPKRSLKIIGSGIV